MLYERQYHEQNRSLSVIDVLHSARANSLILMCSSESLDYLLYLQIRVLLTNIQYYVTIKKTLMKRNDDLTQSEINKPSSS